jgi:hypothetical protein
VAQVVGLTVPPQVVLVDPVPMDVAVVEVQVALPSEQEVVVVMD